MKNASKMAVSAAALCAVALVTGCANERIAVDYLMPARQIEDVKGIRTLAIESQAAVKVVQTNATGTTATPEISLQAAGLLKQLVSARLYKGGYITTTDGICGTQEGPQFVQSFTEAHRANHGYASFAAPGAEAKATLKLSLEAAMTSKPTTREQEYVLLTVPYQVQPAKSGQAPTSKPGVPVPQTVKQRYEVYETVAEGTLKAAIVGADGTELYAAEYPVKLPEKATLSAGNPAPLAALSRAVGPAIDEVLADISPYTETKYFEANQDGDERVRLLLEAKAFDAAIEAAEALEAPTAADCENLGLAYEATGDMASAKSAYERALALDGGSAAAQEALERLAARKAAKKALKASGAKQSTETSFKQ